MTKREEEKIVFKKIMKELKKRYPIKEEDVKQRIKFVIWFDSVNHVPKGRWYIATTCFWTFHHNPTYLKVIDRLIKKYGVGKADVSVVHTSIHDVKGQVFKNKQFIKIL